MAAKPVVLRFVGDTTSLDAAFAKLRAESMASEGRLARFSTTMTRFGKQTQATGRMLTRNLTLPIALVAGAAVKMAVDFESSMTKIVSLVGVSRSQVNAWSKEILDLSGKVAVAPTELADALYFVTSAGFRGAEAMRILEAAGRAAATGLGETKTVADAVTSALNAYGAKNLSAKAAVDVLIATVREGKMPADQLADSLGKVISPAQQMGISFGEVGASIASMTRVGLNAYLATTALRQIFMSFLKPTKDQNKAFREIGTSADEMRKIIREKGLLSALFLLKERSKGNVAMMTRFVPSVRALNGFFAMTGANAANTAKIFDDVEHSTGSLDRAFKATQKTLKFQFHQAWTSIKATLIDLGGVIGPTIAKMARAFASLVGSFKSIPSGVQQVIVVLLGIAALLGPITYMVGGLAAILGFLTSPIGLVVAAVVGLIAVGVILYQKWKPLHDFIDGLVDKFKTFFALFKEGGIHAAITSLGDSFGDGAFGKGIKKALGWLDDLVYKFEAVKSAFQVGGMKGGLEQLEHSFKWVKPIRKGLSELMDMASGMADGLGKAFGALSDWMDHHSKGIHKNVKKIGEVFHEAGQVIKPAVEAIVAILQFLAADIGAIIKVIVHFWKRFGDDIGHWLQMAFDGVINIFRGFFEILKGLFEIIGGIFTLNGHKIWQGVKDVFGGIGNFILGTFQFVVGALGAVMTAMAGMISTAMKGIWHGILWVMKQGWNLFADFVNGVLKFSAAPMRFIAEHTGQQWLVDLLDKLKLPKIDMNDKPEVGHDKPTGGQGKAHFFAAGGIIDRPTLALMGEAGSEVVIPLTRPARAQQLLQQTGLAPTGTDGTRGGLTIQNMTVTALDPRRAARITAEEWAWAAKTGGY